MATKEAYHSVREHGPPTVSVPAIMLHWLNCPMKLCHRQTFAFAALFELRPHQTRRHLLDQFQTPQADAFPDVTSRHQLLVQVL